MDESYGRESILRRERAEARVGSVEQSVMIFFLSSISTKLTVTLLVEISEKSKIFCVIGTGCVLAHQFNFY